MQVRRITTVTLEKNAILTFKCEICEKICITSTPVTINRSSEYGDKSERTSYATEKATKGMIKRFYSLSKGLEKAVCHGIALNGECIFCGNKQSWSKIMSKTKLLWRLLCLASYLSVIAALILFYMWWKPYEDIVSNLHLVILPGIIILFFVSFKFIPWKIACSLKKQFDATNIEKRPKLILNSEEIDYAVKTVKKQIEGKKDVEILLSLIDQIAGLKKEAKINEESEENIDLYNDESQYGLVPDNPIFAANSSEAKTYVARLVSTNGKNITYERVGSKEIEGFYYPVDIYNLCDSNGKETLLYISLYGKTTSDKAPAGFKLLPINLPPDIWKR